MKTRVEKLKTSEKKIKKEKRKKKSKKMIIILLILIVIGFLYGYLIEPRILIVHEKKIITGKIDSSMHGLKIVHFSDLHYGTYYNKKNINKLVKKINATKPDIIVFTGDLVDQSYTLNSEDVKAITKAFNKLDATIDKYAVIGNHDYYLTEVDNILYDSNFKVLINEYDLVYKEGNNPIMIYGVDDVLLGKPNTEKLKDVDNIYKIVLVHEPDYIEEINGADLVLAGHSHNGQVNIPLISKLVLPEGSKDYYKPYYKVNGTNLYISNGVGECIFTIRMFTPPSINLFRLIKK